MADDGVHENVKRFIGKYIDSVEILEVLLLLRSGEKKEWSADSVSGELRSSPISIGRRLTDLYERGLLSRKESTAPPLYYYNPRNRELDSTIKDLTLAYSERRSRVIDLIFSKPIDTLRHFSDAFKFRKDD